jgi:hypothetical protein
MLGLDSLTGVAKGNILGNISIHSIPPIGCLEIMEQLIPSWMNGISELMSPMKYLILQLLDVRHTDPSPTRISAYDQLSRSSAQWEPQVHQRHSLGDDDA